MTSPKSPTKVDTTKRYYNNMIHLLQQLDPVLYKNNIRLSLAPGRLYVTVELFKDEKRASHAALLRKLGFEYRYRSMYGYGAPSFSCYSLKLGSEPARSPLKPRNQLVGHSRKLGKH